MSHQHKLRQISLKRCQTKLEPDSWFEYSTKRLTPKFLLARNLTGQVLLREVSQRNICSPHEVYILLI